MDGSFKRLLRFRELRRIRKRRQKRISNLVANSNCIGTTAHLFGNKWSRATAWDLKAEKKPDCSRTRKYIH